MTANFSCYKESAEKKAESILTTNVHHEMFFSLLKVIQMKIFCHFYFYYGGNGYEGGSITSNGSVFISHRSYLEMMCHSVLSTQQS